MHAQYLLIEVHRQLTAPWELRINPDGSRTILAHPDLPLTNGFAELVNDVQAANRCPCTRQLGDADTAPGATCTALRVRPASTAGRHTARPELATDTPGGIVQPRTAADDERPPGECA
ncbi:MULTISPECIES: hypothetical protein [unclassified Crossiella]|uniref:hypothetical protein n=1 Tax=unclassified Crossiella TaxID=2620835 RepID=UPI001FFE8E36|nr:MULTISPECIES: hypothetical protein [unclassified Crossiella]MCK2239375.1 hypothetical protein [Crossiella sp. S99.2]MCK2252070.1 hypothetical protein [Crossiella sp. S99.1]